MPFGGAFRQPRGIMGSGYEDTGIAGGGMGGPANGRTLTMDPAFTNQANPGGFSVGGMQAVNSQAMAPGLNQPALQRFMQDARARRMAAMSMMRGSPPQGQMGMGLNGMQSQGAPGMGGPIAGKINSIIGG